jgi:hypothetical protein
VALATRWKTPEGTRLIRSNEPVAGSIRSVFGELEFTANGYHRGVNTKVELRPIDARMELPSGKYSHLLEDVSQYVCLEEAFGQSQGAVERFLGQKLPVDSLERVNRNMGDDAKAFLDLEESGQALFFVSWCWHLLPSGMGRDGPEVNPGPTRRSCGSLGSARHPMSPARHSRGNRIEPKALTDGDRNILDLACGLA